MDNYSQEQENYIADLVNQILSLIDLNKHISKREQNCLINNEELDGGIKIFVGKRENLTKDIYQVLLKIDTGLPPFRTRVNEMLNDDEKKIFNIQLNYHLRKLEMLLTY